MNVENKAYIYLLTITITYYFNSAVNSSLFADGVYKLSECCFFNLPLFFWIVFARITTTVAMVLFLLLCRSSVSGWYTISQCYWYK